MAKIKGMDLDSLGNYGNGAEMRENKHNQEEEQDFRRIVKIPSDPYTNFSLSIKMSQKQSLYDYLRELNAKRKRQGKRDISGAQLIIPFLSAIGVFGEPDEEEAKNVIKMIEDAQEKISK